MITEQVRQRLWATGYAFFKVMDEDGEMQMLACAVLDHKKQTVHLGAGKTPIEAMRDAMAGVAGIEFSLTLEVLASLPSIDEVPDIMQDRPQ